MHTVLAYSLIKCSATNYNYHKYNKALADVCLWVTVARTRKFLLIWAFFVGLIVNVTMNLCLNSME